MRLCGKWWLHTWDDGAVIYSASSGKTHSIDPLTTEVLLTRAETTGNEELVKRLAEQLQVPIDGAFREAVAQSLARLQELESA